MEVFIIILLILALLSLLMGIFALGTLNGLRDSENLLQGWHEAIEGWKEAETTVTFQRKLIEEFITKPKKK